MNMHNKNVDLVLLTAGSQGIMDKKHLPLGLIYIGSMLESKGFDVKIHHVLPNETDTVLKQISARTPLWAGFSVLSGITTTYSAGLSTKLKTLLPDIPIVWGGHHPSSMTEQCLRQKYIDIVVKGEGEMTALELSEALQNRISLENVKGISFKKNGKIVHNPCRDIISNIDVLPLNFRLVPLNEYIYHDRGTIEFFSSRGCPYNCAFCSTTKFYGKSYRSHSVEYVTGHITEIKKDFPMIDSIYFSDDNFFIHKERAYNIISSLRKIKIYTRTLDIRLDQIKEEDLIRLRELGVQGIFFGWESGNDRLLKLLNKKITVSDILEKGKLFSKYKDITYWASGMLLLPTETFQETRNTIALAEKIRQMLPNSTVALFRFMALPGTELTAIAEKEGFRMPADPFSWNIIDPITKYYRTDWVKWMTPELDRKFRFIQELTRSGIMNYTFNKNPLIRFPKNLLADIIKLRVRNLFFGCMIEMAIYKIMVRLYSFLYKRNAAVISTEILDRS